MAEHPNYNLIIIPDYLATADVGTQTAGCLLLGDSEKLPKQLQQGDSFFDVRDAEKRAQLMLIAPSVATAKVITPGLGYYKRLSELRDDCFFCDFTERLVANGTPITVVTGMQKDRLLPKVAEWIQELSRWGIRFTYAETKRVERKPCDLITAEEVIKCYKSGRYELIAAANAIITPNARDEAKEKGVTIVQGIKEG